MSKTKMTMSGFCLWPSLQDSHVFCRYATCTCWCHEEEKEE